MPDTTSKHGLGVALVAAAAVAWSTAPFFVRLLPLDSFTILFWRGVFAGSATVVLLVLIQGRSGLTDLTRIHRGGLFFAVLSAVAMLLFIPSLQLTSVANVAIIMATVPFAAAALAWVWFREMPRKRTVLASAVAVLGVAISVGGASAGADIYGILLALLMMLAISGMTVAARRYRDTPLVAAAALSNFLGSAASLPFAQGVVNVSTTDLAILAAFGVLQVALGLTFFVLGSRHLPAAQTALIATLETPLMPFWVWLAFKDAPSSGQLIGGAVVLTAVVADIIGDLRSQANFARESDSLQIRLTRERRSVSAASLDIRPASLGDLDIVQEISASAYVPAYRAAIGLIPKPAFESYRPRIERGEVWLLEVNGRSLGTLVLQENSNHLLIYSIAVLPDQQRRGYGKALLRFADERARVAGLRELRLYTNTRMSHNIALYRSCGFVEVGTRPHPSQTGQILLDMLRILPDE